MKRAPVKPSVSPVLEDGGSCLSDFEQASARCSKGQAARSSACVRARFCGSAWFFRSGSGKIKAPRGQLGVVHSSGPVQEAQPLGQTRGKAPVVTPSSCSEERRRPLFPPGETPPGNGLDHQDPRTRVRRTNQSWKQALPLRYLQFVHGERCENRLPPPSQWHPDQVPGAGFTVQLHLDVGPTGLRRRPPVAIHTDDAGTSAAFQGPGGPGRAGSAAEVQDRFWKG